MKRKKKKKEKSQDWRIKLTLQTDFERPREDIDAASSDSRNIGYERNPLVIRLDNYR